MLTPNRSIGTSTVGAVTITLLTLPLARSFDHILHIGALPGYIGRQFLAEHLDFLIYGYVRNADISFLHLAGVRRVSFELTFILFRYSKYVQDWYQWFRPYWSPGPPCCH
ncbi:jg7329 [Pararge aegeria aegeria]|uniref:Jg7329 protein n=1 Tax=Pararge aegeria aegeria TaxID=348720 RepID=A0A8S4RH67_9NEOP|nr:jg7329 [Pararge aegeria aegeria]